MTLFEQIVETTRQRAAQQARKLIDSGYFKLLPPKDQWTQRDVDRLIDSALERH